MARPLGARVEEGGVRFRVWAPVHDRVDVEVRPPRGEAGVELHPLVCEGEGYFAALVEGAGAGDRYRFALGGECVPDPASRSQPEGVHGASEIVDPAGFSWSDGSWRGVILEDLSVYELHVGTATQEGTFEALIQHLDHFAELGVTALELMPVVEFAGRRGWGYDGVYWFAPHHAYGGPEGLRRLIDAAHARGLAVILDVVYNHFGPEGNYLPALTSGRIFDRSEDTPWGAAIDYGRHAVRELAIGSALHWAREYHVDG
ncbi:MAG: alpha-amylase family glycosyl hydrolase, partial [Longimicrobiaceae bacterium]